MKITIHVRLLFVLLACFGTTFGGSLTGSVTDAETGLPIERARVTLISYLEPGKPTPKPLHTPPVVRTNESGYYDFPSRYLDLVSSERMIISVEAVGYSLAYRVAMRDTPAEHHFELNRPVQVHGVVRGSNNVPVSGAEVWVIYTAPELERTRSEIGLAYTRSDDKGVFTLPSSVGLEFALEVSHPDYLVATSSRMVVTGSAYASGQKHVEYDVELEQGETITGVVNDDFGRPIAGAIVRMSSKNRRPPFYHSRGFLLRLDRETESGADGTFQFRGVAEGTKILRVAVPGGGASEKELAISKGQIPVPVSFSLPRRQ